MSSIILPSLEKEASTQNAPEWKVIVYNNDHNTYQEVLTVLMLATGCDAEEAYIETWEIDHYGQCAVHRASEEECNQAAEIIRTIGVVCECVADD